MARLLPLKPAGPLSLNSETFKQKKWQPCQIRIAYSISPYGVLVEFPLWYFGNEVWKLYRGSAEEQALSFTLSDSHFAEMIPWSASCSEIGPLDEIVGNDQKGSHRLTDPLKPQQQYEGACMLLCMKVFVYPALAKKWSCFVRRS